MPELIRKAGTQGLLAIDIPEKYGGLGLDKATSALVGEAIAIQGSFAVASGVQMGIGTLPMKMENAKCEKWKMQKSGVRGHGKLKSKPPRPKGGALTTPIPKQIQL